MWVCSDKVVINIRSTAFMCFLSLCLFVNVTMVDVRQAVLKSHVH